MAEHYRLYRKDTGKTISITSHFNESRVKRICNEVNNSSLKASGKLVYEKSNKEDFLNFENNFNSELYALKEQN